ncbi:MAG: sensor histidine kinase [Chitinophagaceae bacterium]
MNREPSYRYWAFQLAGWGVFFLINISLAFITDTLSENLFLRLVFFIEMGILFSHLMRETIVKSAILLKSLQRQIITFLILTGVFSLFIAFLQTPFEQNCGLLSEGRKASAFHTLFFGNFIISLPLLFIWNCIYFTYHYVMKSQRQQLDTLHLEKLVKDLELKTIKAHINPHFIFNALNSIRALVDEDPKRARTAITELSNILRSSLNAQKAETVSFKDELKIVKDYLALENMRFEDRLHVEYYVNDKILDKPVPPMMLQTLVENAIKHGISKNVKGGVVRIISDVNDGSHELKIQNTGHLNGGVNAQGFGLSSTQDRLSLLYGDKAKFEIKQLDPTIVEVRILMPIVD